MTYTIKKTSCNNLEKIDWSQADGIELKNYMGSKPEHFPNVLAKLLYNDKNIFVCFRVEDRYVRAAAQKLQGPVCRDSCVEFFFTPGEDIADGYFNLEINCGGTILLKHQTTRSTNTIAVSDSDCKKIEVKTTLPKIVEPEIKEPTIWTLQYALPIEILERYAKVSKPAEGVKWRANFYKCADDTSHPHWLTWAPIDRPMPDFHQPDFFGTIFFK